MNGRHPDEVDADPPSLPRSVGGEGDLPSEDGIVGSRFLMSEIEGGGMREGRRGEEEDVFEERHAQDVLATGEEVLHHLWLAMEGGEERTS